MSGEEADPLAWQQYQLAQCEEEMRDIALDLELDKARKSLYGNDGWKKLQASLADILGIETEKLLRLRMDGYQLGARQGYIKAMRLLSAENALSEKRIAELQDKGSVLVERIRELRSLLA